MRPFIRRHQVSRRQSKEEIIGALCKGLERSRVTVQRERVRPLSFALCWKSPSSDEAEDERETDNEILNDITPAKGAAYEWVSSGCESLHYPLPGEAPHPHESSAPPSWA